MPTYFQNNCAALLGSEKTHRHSAEPATRVGSTIHHVHNRDHQDKTRRNLKSRHIQLISIGGTIGTVLFVQIGTALPIGGPGSLLIAFILWSSVVLSINNCLSETVTWIPISSPFARFADRFVDEALGVCSGLNFFLSLGLSVPFEITAINLMLNLWTDKIPAVAVSIVMILCYAGLNIFAVRYYGESEFWLALGKVVLIIGLLIFTFVVMVGGNPDHDVFGFRNWDGSNVPGAPFVEHIQWILGPFSWIPQLLDPGSIYGGWPGVRR